MTPIALVTPWFGPDTRGGAETQAWNLAHSLQKQGANLEVWTTTSRDSFSSWTEDHYPPGLNKVQGLTVRRWKMDEPSFGVPPVVRSLARSKDIAIPQHLSNELHLLSSLPNSAGLYKYLVEHPERRCMFIPYPMGLSYWGSLLAQGRAYHIPCLHDEPYAYYSTYREMLRRAQGVLFNSHPERELALRLYDLDPTKAHVAGEGIELHWEGDGARFREKTGIHGPIMMYAGRRDIGKNAPTLVSYFREWKAQTGRELTLVLIGPGGLPIAKSYGDWIVDLGFLDVQTKHDAYAAATVFCNPSTIESFSIVLMESWLQSTPALVNAKSDVLYDFALRAGGAIPWHDYHEWALGLELLLDNPELRTEIGQAGRAFVLETCRWEEVARRTRTIIEA